MTSNRERFEEWYLAEFWEGSNCGRAMLKKEHCGGYTYAKPQELWKVWQAAQPAAGEPKPIAYVNYAANGQPYLDWLPGGEDESHALFGAPPAAAHGDEAVRKDAARYQWLRNRLPGSDYRVAGIVYSEGGEGVDEAIDAAMRAQGDGGNA